MATQFDNNLLAMLTNVKQALTPPMDPAAMGGAGGAAPMAPPMDPAAMAGTPGGAAMLPGMPPAQLPPMDPAAAAGGMPPGMPMDPSMMGAGGMPPGGGDPTLAAGGAAGAPGGKLKPEQMFQIISLRLFNIEQQLAETLRQQGKSLDPGAMIQPPDATMAGAPKPPEAIAAEGGSPEQVKAASELWRLHQIRDTLQNQAPEDYDVVLVRRYPDVEKAAADRTNLVANLLERLPGGDADDAAFEDEYQQASLLSFGAKAAEDHLKAAGITSANAGDQLEFEQSILGTPAIDPGVEVAAPSSPSTDLFSLLNIKL